jgi:FKBP-type peptidyl-prolyl cis-trans isomerase 2
MTVGETKQFQLKAEQAYGAVKPDGIREVEKSRIPEGARHIGAELGTPDDDTVRARVVEVRDEVVVLDFNHPLAGKDLSFEIKVLDVKTGPGNG